MGMNTSKKKPGTLTAEDIAALSPQEQAMLAGQETALREANPGLFALNDAINKPPAVAPDATDKLVAAARAAESARLDRSSRSQTFSPGMGITAPPSFARRRLGGK